MNAVVCLLLVLSLCFSASIFNVEAAADTKEKTPGPECTSATEGQLRQFEPIVNSTCGTRVGRVQICNNGTWKTVCDNNWTTEDAMVACRHLGFSALEASVEHLILAQSDIYEFIPNCDGSEDNLTNCQLNPLNPVPDRCNPNLYAVKCFDNDSAVQLCYESPTFSTEPQSTETTNKLSTTEASGTRTTTTVSGIGPTEFITSPLGIGIITVICVVVLFIIILLVVISLLVCRKSSVTKLEQSRISPQDLENSLKDSESSRYDNQDSKFSTSGNSSPGRSRAGDANAEQYVLASDPLYERVQDVTIPILAQAPGSATNSTGNSAEQSPQLQTYSTLERGKTLEENPTYSTLNMEDQVYAQVEPFINGSLPRDASLQIDPGLDNFDTYHRLDRSNSQSSHRKTSVTSSPPTRHAKPYSSPNTPRNPLPSISDEVFSPLYAEVTTPTEQASKASNAAFPSGHRSLKETRSNTVSGRPATHEQVTPKGKSSTLPHPSKSTSHINSHGVDVSAMYAQVDMSAKGNNTWV